jgi:hypothetical protein
MSRTQLTVRVTDDLVLDAGSWETIEGDNPQRVVYPPTTTIFDQLIDYLEQRPISGYPGIRIGHEAIAATAVCIRWGSYFAVLADRDKLLTKPCGRDDAVAGRIADDEMARINIEASAALEAWINIMRADYDRYLGLMWAAHRYLPMTRKSVKRSLSPIGALTQTDFVEELSAIAGMDSDWYQAQLVEAKEHPTRVLANALINFSWRNGPIESIHGGYSSLAYPLTRCRILKQEERKLVRTTASRLADGLMAAFYLAQNDGDDRAWWERVLPYNLVVLWHITPTGWSLTERTRQVVLPGSEPGWSSG